MAYPEARTRAREILRRSVLDTASELLQREGPHGLSMRRIAGAAGCSTMVLYRMFGNKDGLVRALYEEGFKRLTERMAAVSETGNAGEETRALSRAYRAFAQENPAYFNLMFGQPIPEFRPPEAWVVRENEGFQRMARAVRRAMEQGVFVRRDPEEVADLLWAATHGFVSLELKGYFPDPAEAERRFRQLHEVTAFGVRNPSWRPESPRPESPPSEGDA